MKQPSQHRGPRILTIVGVLGVLLVVLAGLQYYWLGQMTSSERERLWMNMGKGSWILGVDIDRTVASIFETFDIVAATPEEARDAIERRHIRWQERSPDPEIVHSVYFTRSPEGPVDVVDPALGYLVPLSESEEQRIRNRLLEIDARPEEQIVCRDNGGIPLLASPVRSAEGSDVLVGWTLIELDSEFLTEHYLPLLVKLSFELETPDTFKTAVVSKANRQAVLYSTAQGQTIVAPEVIHHFFSLRLRNRMALSPALDKPRRSLAEIVEEQEQWMETARDDWDEPVMEWGEGCLSVISTHASGSLEDAIAHMRKRNMLIGFGVLALLAASGLTLALTSRRAQRLAQQQMEFVAGVSHELRTPLTVIRSAGENLADAIVDDPEKVEEYGNVIRREGQRLSDMVENVLSFSREQVGEIELRPVSIRETIATAVQACRRFIDTSGVHIEVNAPDSLPDVMGDEPALVSVLQNLISNAIKYGPKHQRISITARKMNHDSRPEIQVAVRDQGSGIPTNEMPQLFEPFFRGRRAHADQIQGSGLGLTVVRRVVEAHGGHVTVNSAPGGSVFVIHLPSGPEAGFA
ncbi:MAG: HAMP domain-containing sensor histidine kinase [Gammaproteobacteria bacterium]